MPGRLVSRWSNGNCAFCSCAVRSIDLVVDVIKKTVTSVLRKKKIDEWLRLMSQVAAVGLMPEAVYRSGTIRCESEMRSSVLFMPEA